MTSSPLRVTVSYDGWSCVLSATGDLDLTTTARFARCAFRALDDQPGRLAFDLAGLTFLDCAGARALAAAAHAAQQDCPVLLRSASPIASRMLHLRPAGHPVARPGRPAHRGEPVRPRLRHPHPAMGRQPPGTGRHRAPGVSRRQA